MENSTTNIEPLKNKKVQKDMLHDGTLPPEKQRRLNLSTAQHSLVFSQLNRLDCSKPLYRKHRTFWQFKSDLQQPIEVVGWYEPKPIPEFKINIDNNTDRSCLIHSKIWLISLCVFFQRLFG